MEVDIFDNFEQFEEILVQLSEKEIARATRRALKTTSRSTRVLATKRLKQLRRLNSTFIKERLPLRVKATGNVLANMRASLEFSGKPISLIHFVNKSSLKKRVGLGGAQLKGKKITARIEPGKTTKLRKAFYAQGRNNNEQLFRRSSRKRLPLKSQSTPSLGAIIGQQERLAALAKITANKFAKNYNTELKFVLGVKLGEIRPNKLKKRR